MNEKTKQQGRRLLHPLVQLLLRLEIAPTTVTLVALPLAVCSGWLFASGRFVIAGVLVALIGLCDTLDGELARQGGRQSQTGALIDSTVDRLSEGLVIGGIFWFYRNHPFGAVAALAALFFSLMVSYVRARAEGIGRECRVGLFERPIRVLLLLVGAFLLGRTYMPVALAVIAAGSLLTTVHRLLYACRH